MLKKTKLYQLGVSASAGIVALSYSGMAYAAAAAGGGGNTFSTVSTNIAASLEDVPGLIAALCYIFAIIILILGILKIKDHMDKPDQSPLKDGVVRLLVGGVVLALPLLLNVMKETIDAGSTATASSAQLTKATFTTVP